MFDRGAMKTQVRQDIKGKWITPFLVLLLVEAATAAVIWLVTFVAMIPLSVGFRLNSDLSVASVAAVLIFTIVVLVLTAGIMVAAMPLMVSLYGYFLKFSRGENPTLGDAFSGYKNFGKNVKAMLWMYLWVIIWMLPFILLVSAGTFMFSTVSLARSGYVTLSNSTANAGLGMLFTLLSLAALVPALIKGYSYSQTVYIVADNPDIGARRALNLSKTMMQGHKAELFVLALSFIGWELLACVTCGIAYIYVLPYIHTAYARYHDAVRRMNFEAGTLSPEDFGQAPAEVVIN